MKVLFATYPMAFHTPGGGEIQLLAYRKHLPAHGVDVTLFDPWNPCFLEHDVVHFFSCVGGSVHFCNFVKQLQLPLVVSSSLWVTEDTKHLYPMGEIHHQFSLADRVVTNSDIESDTLARVLDLPREKFVSVLNGVEPIFYDRQPPSSFKDAFDLRESFILNVGNIEPRKNQLALVRAMKSLPELKLVLIGHQRDPAYARACLEEGGDQVIYLGALPHESPILRAAYAACEVFCLPSTLETPGLAALEAHAAGARIAITRVGSTEEYFGRHVTYLDPNDVSSIAQSIRLAMTLEPAAARPERDLSWQAMLAPLKTLYTSLSTA
ncbi:glycosyl transferase [Burkholderia diffusa]|uniref:Glycosyl transferase n=1 Tax=Burkholderia diffusa TaxID=488732 RepID=A0AAW3PKD0_9BURK|nr:glycosyltransferase [Burkholderia diffusa]KVH47213.1 glycosyl transferase [Burkholderia diffusa]KVM93770.1 glycosyl transferase [Burkholderia diffusa]KWF27794.1 glycosyl transferase [Burkholderia diffusa]KWF31596.1 glycosyl transferase [Burkholderia diffusa]KWF42936.1 glycosyl transferase [Burkholderia diffusa]